MFVNFKLQCSSLPDDIQKLANSHKVTHEFQNLTFKLYM